MIGATVSAIGGLQKALERASKYEYDCTQIYTTNSRRWNVPLIQTEVASNILQYAIEKKVTLVSHVPFLVNLSSSKKLHRKNSIERLRIEILNANLLGIKKLVLHPGNSGENSKDTAIEYIIQGINAISGLCISHDVVMLLETMSGQGTQIGRTFEEIKKIISNVTHPEVIGVCFDTAHVFAAGYDISNLGKLKEVLVKFDNCIGINKIGCLHLNNTNVPCGKGSDRHTSIFDGRIDLEVFIELVADSQFIGIPKILEPPSDNKKDKFTNEIEEQMQLDAFVELTSNQCVIDIPQLLDSDSADNVGYGQVKYLQKVAKGEIIC